MILEKIKLGQFILHYNQRALSKAKNKGENYLTRYLRGVASNFIKRQDVRSFIMNRDNFKCRFCGSTDNLTIDHIIPVVINGIESNHPDNFRVLCKSCNFHRGMAVDEWK